MMYDVIIVGAGPGGMQAGIAAASEGLSVLVLEKGKVGGQIGQTPLLENSVFSGSGMTGPEFAAMMHKQAIAMGVEFLAGNATRIGRLGKSRVKYIDYDSTGSSTDNRVLGHTVVLAMGMRWQELDIPGLRSRIGNDVFIGPVKSITYDAEYQDVIVYGGGPSAGQAILALAKRQTTANVEVLLRSKLRMPQYLVDRIHAHPNVRLHESTMISSVDTHEHGRMRVVASTGKTFTVHALFMCNGLAPDTSWLPKWIEVDEYGQVETTAGVVVSDKDGVYAIGDCRSGSTPRVGAAIGDGSLAVTEIWKYFQRNPVCSRCEEILGIPKRMTNEIA